MVVLRAVLFAFCLVVAALVAVVAVRVCRPGGRAAQWLGQLFCRALLRVLRIRIEVSGEPPRTGAGVLLVANHVSWIDPLVLFAITPAAVLAKREVGTWPVISAFARLQATVFVDRKRRRGIPKVNQILAQRLEQNHNVLLFPEGTTFDGDRRGRFLTSHLACLAGVMRDEPGRPAAAAQAAAIAYSDRSAAWIGDDTLLPHLWLMLRNPGMTCRVAFSAPLAVPRGYDRKVLGRRLAEEVEILLPSGRPARDPFKRQNSEPVQGLIVTQA